MMAAKRSTRTISIRMALCCSSARVSLRFRTVRAKGQGFTHVEGDLVTVATSKLGRFDQSHAPERGLRGLGSSGLTRLSRR